MRSQEERKSHLEALLGSGNFDFEFHFPDNIQDPVLLIKNYRRSVSLGFSLTDFYSESGGLGRKCWMSQTNVRKINEEDPDPPPNPYPNYKEFERDGVTYHPFSADLTEYTLENLDGIKLVCEKLFQHIVFDNA